MLQLKKKRDNSTKIECFPVCVVWPLFDMAHIMRVKQQCWEKASIYSIYSHSRGRYPRKMIFPTNISYIIISNPATFPSADVSVAMVILKWYKMPSLRSRRLKEQKCSTYLMRATQMIYLFSLNSQSLSCSTRSPFFPS